MSSSETSRPSDLGGSYRAYGLIGADPIVLFEAVVADEVLATSGELLALIPRLQTLVCALIAQSLIDELDDPLDGGERVDLNDAQRNAVYVAAGALVNKIELYQVRQGSIIAIVFMSVAVIHHWLPTIAEIVGAMQAGVKTFELASRVVKRLNGGREGWKPQIPEGAAGLPPGTVIVVEPRKDQVTITIGKG